MPIAIGSSDTSHSATRVVQDALGRECGTPCVTGSIGTPARA